VDSLKDSEKRCVVSQSVSVNICADNNAVKMGMMLADTANDRNLEQVVRVACPDFALPVLEDLFCGCEILEDQSEVGNRVWRGAVTDALPVCLVPK
jgi:hypothetical protein